MSCEHVKDLLSAYLDNALTTGERVDVQEHINTCSVCCEILADYRRFDALLADLPRVSPGPQLHDKIFTSPEYLELSGRTGITSLHDFSRAPSCDDELRETPQPIPLRQFRQPHIEEHLTLPEKRRPHREKTRPHLVALPGGLQETRPRLSAQRQQTQRRRRTSTSLRFMQLAIAACLLLTLGIGGLIGWNMWQQQNLATLPDSITPPLGPRLGGPLPAGTRFVFLSHGALWSGTTDSADNTGSNSVLARLTPTNVVVASHWSVRPAFSGRAAGNMLAYIDLKQGRVHIIRSDGQNDATIFQPLFGTISASQWNTPIGATILNSLAWSPDGSKLAFIAAPRGTAHLYVYSLDTNHLQFTPLTIQGEVLSLNWSGNATTPAITWSVGTPGHIHTIMQQNLAASATQAKVLLTGDYASASYSSVGNWLLLSQTHDIFTLTTNGVLSRWTHGESASLAAWSPKGSFIGYFSNLKNGSGAYHILRLTTGSDTQLATNVASNALPAWSPNEQYLLYSDGISIFVVNLLDSSSTQIHVTGTPSLLAWNPALSEQAIVALQINQGKLYVLDRVHGTVTQMNGMSVTGPVLWTEIP